MVTIHQTVVYCKKNAIIVRRKEGLFELPGIIGEKDLYQSGSVHPRVDAAVQIYMFETEYTPITLPPPRKHS